MDKVSAYKVLIGPLNQDYYLSYFRRAEERGYAPPSWHWPVLFLGVFWLLWRKQYRWAIFTVVLGIATSVIAGIVTDQTGSQQMGTMASYLLSIPYLGIYLPVKANAIYYDWCNQALAEAQEAAQPDKQAAWLARKGGVNRNLPMYLVLGFSVFVLLLSLSGPAPQ